MVRFRSAAAVTMMVMGSIVLAQSTGGAIALGRGAAVASGNRRGGFQFEVGRRLIEGQLRPAGSFVLETTDPEVVGAVRIRIPNIDEIAPDGATCRFAGNGDMRFKPRERPVVERTGRVRVMVRDNRPANARNGMPDRIAVTFTSPSPVAGQPPLTYTFEGNLVEGDIVVRRPQ